MMETLEELFLNSIDGRTFLDDKGRLMRYTNVRCESPVVEYKFEISLPDGTSCGEEWYSFEQLRGLRVMQPYEKMNPDGSITVEKEYVSAGKEVRIAAGEDGRAYLVTKTVTPIFMQKME